MNQQEVNSLFGNISDYDSVRRKHVIKAPVIENEQRVYSQALRHNIWLKDVDLIKDKFPNESKSITDYRSKNKRQFTKEVPRKAIQGVISILSSNPIKVESNNAKFNTWFDSLPFFYKADKLDFYKWAINALIPYSFVDPNAILIPFPLFKSEFDTVGLRPIIVPFNRRYIDPNGNYLIVLEEGTKNFWVSDKLELYYVEFGQTNTYTLVYTHNLGELPFTYLPGITSFDENTKNTYNESILAATYEYLDEALISFTTDQAVRTKMNSIMIRPGLACGSCNGTTLETNNEGKEINCHTCKGTGLAKRPSDLDDFIILPADSIQGEGKVPIKPEYINPDTSVAEFWSKTWKEYLNEGKKSIGIDALIDKAESGEAMKKRLASFEEFISYLIYLTYDSTCTKFFELCHKLLNPKESDWKDFPIIKTPKRVEIKTPEILKQNFNEAIGSEKIQAAFEYYESLYGDDPIMLRAMKLLLEYYPASIEKNEDLQTLSILGVYTSREIAKSKRALIIIRRILEQKKATEPSDEVVIKQAEEELNKLIPDKLVQSQA